MVSYYLLPINIITSNFLTNVQHHVCIGSLIRCVLCMHITCHMLLLTKSSSPIKRVFLISTPYTTCPFILRICIYRQQKSQMCEIIAYFNTTKHIFFFTCWLHQVFPAPTILPQPLLQLKPPVGKLTIYVSTFTTSFACTIFVC